MVHVSEAASAFILNHLASIPVPSDTGYRLDTSRGGYRLRLDRPSDEDRVVKTQGQVMLMIAPDLDEELDGIVLDLREGEGEGLVLEPADTTEAAGEG